LKPETISRLYQLIVGEGHRLNPVVATTARVDSFVIETNIHYPTESSLIWDGLRKVIDLSVVLADDLDVWGWRQHIHLLKKIKNLNREISRIARSKNPQAKKQLRKQYSKLLKSAREILNKAENLLEYATKAGTVSLDRVESIRVFMRRTRQVSNTAYRRVMLGETVPNEDKLFSIYEPHTQLYRRGKAGQDNQFGRLALIFEDGAGFITHHHLMGRDEQDVDVAVSQTKIVQERLNNVMETISFDRGFYSEQNESDLNEIVTDSCLPKKSVNGYAEQMKDASVKFRAARQNHSGVESAIGALQSGNGLKRSRDRTEIGFERYLCLAILGRNLHLLGKMLIAQRSPDSLAGQSKRKSAA
jgi:hypothetical protein